VDTREHVEEARKESIQMVREFEWATKTFKEAKVLVEICL